jgi:hypothetical protein
MKKAKAYLMRKLFFLPMLLLLFLPFFMSTPVNADDLWEKQVGMGTGDGEVGNVYGESDADSVSDIRVVLARLISVFLGFMGIVFLILIIYGGFLWMTASGNEENVKKAKSLMFAGIIGLIIILSSFAIAQLVTDNVYTSTIGDPSPTP